MKLKDIANIKVKSGLVLSRKRDDSSKGISYPLLTLKSIQPEGMINLEELDEFSASEKLAQDYVTCEGDIIVRLSAPYTAVMIDEKTSGFVIASNFVLIRAANTKILPEYLYWFLNTKEVKKTLYASSTTNMLGAVKPTFFANLEIQLPSESDQKKIADFNMLAKRESYLLRKLAEEKELYYAAMIEKLQKGAMEHDKAN